MSVSINVSFILRYWGKCPQTFLMMHKYQLHPWEKLSLSPILTRQMPDYLTCKREKPTHNRQKSDFQSIVHRWIKLIRFDKSSALLDPWEENALVTGRFDSQKVSNVDSAFMSWHDVMIIDATYTILRTASYILILTTPITYQSCVCLRTYMPMDIYIYI